MVKSFFHMEDWETNVFKSRKYSTFPILVTEFKRYNYKVE